jgi:chorismate synthase
MTTDIIYRYKNQVYFNITNKCPCRCTFCIRNTEDAIGEASNLWFEHEPALEEIYKAIDEFDFSDCNEVVFCGYGEPTMALENLIAVSKYIRERYPFRIRLNTNGLSDLIHKRSTAKEICQAVDSISISLNMPDKVAAEETAEFLERMIAAQDSVGGVVECLVDGMPAGVGEPVFDKLDARLAGAIMSIGAVKGFEIGDGFAAAKALGSKNNDEFYVDAYGKVNKKTNHAGGILGGMSDGSQIVLRAAFKPTPSIAQLQKTANNHGENVEIAIKGRHDPVVVPRAVVVVEAMTALTIVDLLLMGKNAKLD